MSTLPFTRCPECAAVAWPGWAVTHRHRPICKYADVSPRDWPKETTDV
jgi:hypothetical protein